MVSQIANMSTSFSQAKIQQAVGMKLMKVTMDNTSSNAQNLVQAMMGAAQPNLGSKIDLTV